MNKTTINILDYCHFDGYNNVVDVESLNRALKYSENPEVFIPSTGPLTIKGSDLRYVLNRSNKRVI